MFRNTLKHLPRVLHPQPSFQSLKLFRYFIPPPPAVFYSDASAIYNIVLRSVKFSTTEDFKFRFHLFHPAVYTYYVYFFFSTRIYICIYLYIVICVHVKLRAKCFDIVSSFLSRPAQMIIRSPWYLLYFFCDLTFGRRNPRRL